MKDIIVSSNLELKLLEQKDAISLFQIIDKERDELRNFLPFVDFSLHISDTQKFVDAAIINTNNPTYTIVVNNKVLGLIGLKDTDLVNRKTEIGYWISNAGRGKGYVTAACKAMIGTVFRDMNMNRIQIKVSEKNLKSIAIPERLGFKFEGIERDGELLVDGFTNIRVYSLLRKDTDSHNI